MSTTGYTNFDVITETTPEVVLTADPLLGNFSITIKIECAEAYRKALNFMCYILENGFCELYTEEKGTTGGSLHYYPISPKSFLPIPGLPKAPIHAFYAQAIKYPEIYPEIEKSAWLSVKRGGEYHIDLYGDYLNKPGSFAMLSLITVDKKYLDDFAEYFTEDRADEYIPKEIISYLRQKYAQKDSGKITEALSTKWFNAIIGGYATKVRELLEEYPELLNTTNEEGASGLFVAIDHKILPIARLLLDSGANPHITNHYNQTVLLAASDEGCEHLVSRLISMGVDVNKADTEGQTALLFAANSGNTAVVRILLKAGAQINIIDKNMNTPLVQAVCQNRFAVAIQLIEAGADINTSGVADNTPMMYAFNSKNIALLTLFAQRIASPNAADKDGTTLAMMAAELPCTDVIEILAERGADLNAVNGRGHTALWHAVLNSNTEMVKWLLQAGAKPTVPEKEEQTPLQLAIEKDDIEKARLLKEAEETAVAK